MPANPYQSPAPAPGGSWGSALPLGRPTNIRHAILLATTLAAFLMYLDRICIGWIIESDSFKSEIQLDPPRPGEETPGASAGSEQASGATRPTWQKDWIKQAFFWAYAFAQVPAGWLAERFGKRTLMTAMIVLWSIFTALTSFANGFEMLLLARAGCGLAQAGAYPIAGSLISKWVIFSRRGLASSIVSLGGRLGGAFAPLITVSVIVYFNNWRMAGWIYGLIGIGVAFAFWYIFRERPEEHPRCNSAEVELLTEGRPPEKPAIVAAFPLRAVLGDASLWMMCGMQFLTNVGWAFVINSIPTYFKDVLQLSDSQSGRISTIVLFIGFVGLIAGGFITDACGRVLGIRMGRMLPIALTRFVAAIFFLLCLTTTNPWMLAGFLGLMAFCTDAGIPATWAYAQDVGGKQIAPILGWGNMWGNFGAALQPQIIAYVNQWDTNRDYHEAFLVSAGAFALAGLLALGINAARPIVREK
jgi:MFS family permease